MKYRDKCGRWSIHEIIVDNTDSVANSYILWRRIIAEQGAPLMAYDENQWAAALDYHEQSAEDTLALFKRLRHMEIYANQDAAQTRLGACIVSPRRRRYHARRLA